MSNYSEDQALLVRLINADCFKDYYTILGVDKNRTSPEEIRKAYKNLCLRVHPDKNRAPGADEAFKKIDNAYRKLLLLHTSTASPPPHQRPSYNSNPNSNHNSNSNPKSKPKPKPNPNPNPNPNPKPRGYSCDNGGFSEGAVISMLVGGVFVFVIFVGLCHSHQPIRHTY